MNGTIDLFTPDTFVIADWHIGHKNIITYADREENWEEIAIKQCNKVCHKSTKLLNLGDLSLTNKENTLKFVNQLRCKHRFLVLGNHDDNGLNWYEDLGFRVLGVTSQVFVDAKGKERVVVFSHKPIERLPKEWINVHGHIHRGFHRSHQALDQTYFNVSCEVLNYEPIQIKRILEIVNLREDGWKVENEAQNFSREEERVPIYELQYNTSYTNVFDEQEAQGGT